MCVSMQRPEALTVTTDVRGVRVRCGRARDWTDRCGWTLARWLLDESGALKWDDHFEPANVRLSPTLRPGGVTRDRLVVRETDQVSWGAAKRIQPVCKCGAHHVLDVDKLRPVFDERASAGQVRSNGWVDVYTGEF